MRSKVVLFAVTAVLAATVCLLPAAAARAGIPRAASEVRAEAPVPRVVEAPSEVSAPAPAALTPVGDIRHIKEVQSYLNVLPSPIFPPLVYYIGDSTARESVVSEGALVKAIAARTGGLQTQAYVLASSNQTFPVDQFIADGLPRGVGRDPALVLIAVGLSRFTNKPATSSPLGDPLGPITQLSPWAQHKYSARKILTTAQKRALVKEWLAKRRPLFTTNEPEELDKLQELVRACKERGWKVALVEMPLNTAIIGHAFDKPRAKFRADCLAAMPDVPYLKFRPAVVGLTNANFYDLIHLVGNGASGDRSKWGGRAKFQASLAAQIAPLLAPPQP